MFNRDIILIHRLSREQKKRSSSKVAQRVNDKQKNESKFHSCNQNTALLSAHAVPPNHKDKDK